MKRMYLPVAVMAATGMFFATTQSAVAEKGVNADTPARSDQHFAREAAIGGMTEVELGRLAVQKSSNEKVKEFGQRMIDDHTKADDQLKAVAAKDVISLPSDLDAQHRALVDRYSRMSGTAFDRAYVRDMVRDHETDVAAFEREANSGNNPDLKNFANETLPTLREHLKLAKENEQAMGVTSSTRK